MASLALLAASDVALLGAGDMAFGRRCHALSGVSSGAGDMASLGGIVVDVMAVSLSASLPRLGPNAGSHQGAQWRWWQPRMMVVGGGVKVQKSDQTRD